MINQLSIKVFATTSALKFLVAFLQVFASILYFRHMGVEEYGQIILYIALIETFMLFAVPGIQKVALKNRIQGKSIIRIYTLKLILLSLTFLLLLAQDQTMFFALLCALVSLEHLNSLHRTALHADRKLLTLVLLDAIKPSLSILLICTYILINASLESHVYLYVFSLSVFIETVICAHSFIPAMRIPNTNPVPVGNLIMGACIGSGFSVPTTLMRRLPIILGGYFSVDLSALLAIYMQFITLMNYMISAAMMQISVGLLDAASLKQKHKLFAFNNTSILIIFIYSVIFFAVDLCKVYWLPLIFKIDGSNAGSIFCLYFLPMITFIWQYHFYSLFGQNSQQANILICLTCIVISGFTLAFLYIGKWYSENDVFFILATGYFSIFLITFGLDILHEPIKLYIKKFLNILINLRS